MPKTASVVHPSRLLNGDRVTIADGNGNELTGLVRTGVSDNQLERTVSMRAFGKDIRVAHWEAGRNRWASDYPVIARDPALF